MLVDTMGCSSKGSTESCWLFLSNDFRNTYVLCHPVP